MLYPRSAKLQAAMNEYFIVVVELCHYLFKFGKKSTVQQFTSALNNSHLIAFQTSLDRWSVSIKEEIHLLETQENSGFRALAKGMFKSTSHQQKHAAKMRVLDYCSMYDHLTTWKQIKKAGNTSIHRNCAEYQRWKTCSSASTLIYTGKLGSGKSVLLANIVDDINLTTENGKALVAYFFCRHDITESLLAQTILGSLTRQLLCTIPDLEALAGSCEDTHITSDTNRLLELLSKGFASKAKLYLVLDGLDECDNDEKQKVVDTVRIIQRSWEVSVCASFRPEPYKNLRPVVDRLVATSIVPLPEENPDIESFIESSLTGCLDRETLKISDPSLILEIQDALVQGSKGMFLWVSLQIQSLCSMKTDRDIREALADLPKDLSQTFSRILKKSGGLDRSLQVKTMQLVLAAYRPLTTEQLRETLSVTLGDAKWDPSKLLNDVYSALACCGCLLCVDEEESTVRVVHHSVKQYILHELEDTDYMGFSMEEAQRTSADIVVTYLSYGVFGTQLSRFNVRPIMAQSAPSRILYNTMENSVGSRLLAMKILQSKKQPAFDMSKAITEAQSSYKSKPESSFKFYGYAKIHWQNHLLYVTGKDKAIFEISKRLIRSHILTLNMSGGKFWEQCQWAVDNGYRNIVELLAETGNFETSISPDRRFDCENIPKLILSLEKDTPLARGVDVYGWLNWAARNGHKAVVKTLLRKGRYNDTMTIMSDDSPIISAVKNGDEEMVELLLGINKDRAEVSLNYEIWPGQPMSGEYKGIRIFPSNIYEGGSVTGQSPLMVAASMGDENIVKLLLSTGKVNISTVDLAGYTAQDLAEENGHEHIVELLESYGENDDGGLLSQKKEIMQYFL